MSLLLIKKSKVVEKNINIFVETVLFLKMKLDLNERK